MAHSCICIDELLGVSCSQKWFTPFLGSRLCGKGKQSHASARVAARWRVKRRGTHSSLRVAYHV